MQLHLKVIDDSLPKQGKANQGKGLFCTSSRTNEVPFIAHELVQHLPTAQCSFSKHEHDSHRLDGMQDSPLGLNSKPNKQTNKLVCLEFHLALPKNILDVSY